MSRDTVDASTPLISRPKTNTSDTVVVNIRENSTAHQNDIRWGFFHKNLCTFRLNIDTTANLISFLNLKDMGQLRLVSKQFDAAIKQFSEVFLEEATPMQEEIRKNFQANILLKKTALEKLLEEKEKAYVDKTIGCRLFFVVTLAVNSVTAMVLGFTRLTTKNISSSAWTVNIGIANGIVLMVALFFKILFSCCPNSNPLTPISWFYPWIERQSIKNEVNRLKNAALPDIFNIAP